MAKVTFVLNVHACIYARSTVSFKYKCHAEWDILFGQQGLIQVPAQNFYVAKKTYHPIPHCTSEHSK